VRTEMRAVLHHGVHRLKLHQVQRLFWMAWLTARPLAAPPAQTLRFACQAVTRGRLAASVAILGQPTF
jgi:hypothetical protein